LYASEQEGLQAPDPGHHQSLRLELVQEWWITEDDVEAAGPAGGVFGLGVGDRGEDVAELQVQWKKP